MFHLTGHYGSIGATANSALTPNVDGLFTVQSGRLILPVNMQVMAAYACGGLLNEARLNVPSLRSIALPRISPIDRTSAPTNRPPVQTWRGFGPKILRTEGIAMEVSNSGAGPTATHGLLWLRERITVPLASDIITIKATSSTVGNVGTWTQGNMSLESDLPAGRYQLVGASCQGTNVLAIRFRFPDQNYLPGVISQQATGEYNNDYFRYGTMGVFGEFDSYSVPTIEIMGTGATNTQDIYLDLVRI